MFLTAILLVRVEVIGRFGKQGDGVLSPIHNNARQCHSPVHFFGFGIAR